MITILTRVVTDYPERPRDLLWKFLVTQLGATLAFDLVTRCKEPLQDKLWHSLLGELSQKLESGIYD